jgi:heat shock protein HslJ
MKKIMKPKKIVLILFNLALLLNACAGIGAVSQADLEGHTWVLTNLNGIDPIENHEPTLEFEPGQVSGNTGCNHYGGKYRVEGISIRFDDLFNNEMACLEPEKIMEQEQIYMELLRAVDRFEVMNDSLTLLTATGQTLIFVSQLDEVGSVITTLVPISDLQSADVTASASTPTFEPPVDFKIYQDHAAGVMLFLPKNWIVTSVIEGKSAVFQSYPEDKYVGGELIEPGDTKCDLNIQPEGTLAADLIQQWQSDPMTSIVSEEVFALQTGLTGQRFEIESMGSAMVFLIEVNHKVVVLTCFGDFTQVDAFATTLKALE